MEDFSAFDLSEQVMKNLAAKKYEKPSAVQAGAIPIIKSNKDLVIQSHTGSGKTAAFGIPVIEGVMTDVPAVQYLILVPTRELAAQVRDELESLSEGTGVMICAIYGGADMKKQVKALKKGAQVVVGTPGRILDHLKRRTMSFSVVRGVVLDEADKMLSMGFLPDVQLIFRHLPKRRQMVMSSATFPYTVEQLIFQYMFEPEKLMLSSDDMAPKEIEHQFCMIQNEDKEKVLLALIEKEAPELSLIFCNTKTDVKSVHFFLTRAGIKAEALSSDLSQNQRERVLKKLKTGQFQHLVCTDLAARGIDIPTLSHVFHYSASGDSETYVHRSGRTGRAGKWGKAISLVASMDMSGFRTALMVNSIEAEEITPPTEEEIVAARVEKHIQALNLIDYGRGTDVKEEFMNLAERLTPEQAKSMLPLLLEHFRRPEIFEPIEAPTREDASEEQAPRERTSDRGPRHRERGNTRRDRGRDRNPRSRTRRDRDERPPRESRPPREARSPREREPRAEERAPRERAPQDAPPRDSRNKSFTTVCVGLGRLDGLDEMDLQSILRRQGRARMDDIGDIAMKDHESFVDIGGGSLSHVLAADGKHYKSFELFVTKSGVSVEDARKA